MSGERIRVYGTMWCPHCSITKQFLQDQRIDYEWIDIDADPKAAARVEKINDGMRSVPTIILTDGSVLVEPSNDELAGKLGLRLKAAKDAYDLIILGAGPAGLTAAMYAGRDGMECLVIDRGGLGGQAARIGRIENLPGFPEGIAGADFADLLVAHARRYDVELLKAVRVQNVRRDDGGLVVSTKTGDDYRAKAVLVATGSGYKRLGVPGEEGLVGRGIHFCATCDGPFYKGADEILVVGGGNAGLQEALLLSKFAKLVRVVEMSPRLTATRSFQERVVGQPGFDVRMNVEVVRFEGKKNLEGVVLKDRMTGREEESHPAAAFLFVGPEPATSFLRESVELDRDGFVVTAGHATSLPGLFAAGDVRSGATRQVGAATGDGISAFLEVRSYLEEQRDRASDTATGG